MAQATLSSPVTHPCRKGASPVSEHRSGMPTLNQCAAALITQLIFGLAAFLATAHKGESSMSSVGDTVVSTVRGSFDISPRREFATWFMPVAAESADRVRSNPESEP